MQMRAIRQRLVPVMLAMVLWQVPLAGQVAPAWAKCNQDALSTWNCASYYSGTVSLVSDLKGPSFHNTRSVTATITAGKVVCQTKSSEQGEFGGPGLLAVTHASTATAGDYEIQVWCPEEPGAKAQRGDSPMLQTYTQHAADYATLGGTDAHEHPEADAANNVTGTEKLTWNLRRN
jgi:hypothetical protein